MSRDIQLVDDVRYYMNIQMPKNRELEKELEHKEASGLTLEDAAAFPSVFPEYVAIDMKDRVGIDTGFGGGVGISEVSDEMVSDDDLGHGLYTFNLARVKTPLDLLGWIDHLTEKTWMDRARIHEFVIKVAAYKGWELHTNS